ncbi:unnamed protein product [Cylindrotheca closterium]|uniref:Uncharacterized protein n=1 Tax=Cylindrotheca closterium TaxID=2856 RepID=A0AAD2G2L2_9STRA|nr:unnamed protein product [Cylindrotheca closterium]
MKLIQAFLFSCFIYHSSTAFSPSRQGFGHDVFVLRHSWHDSDFYNSQSDRTRRPLHDKGKDNAYDPNHEEKFSASLYRRPGSATYSPPPHAEPISHPQHAIQPPAPVAPTQPAIQPTPNFAAAPDYQANAMQQNVLARQANAMQQNDVDRRLESVENSLEEIKLTLNYIASLMEKNQQ